MARLRYNGLTTTLGAALTNSATSVTFGAALTHSGGTAVPTIAGSDYIPLTILDGTGAVSEIVYLTAYTTGATTGTITRGQEGTTGVAHSSGDKVVHGPTTRDLPGGRPLVDPTGYAWSWANQGVASIATGGASLLLSSPAENADNWHLRIKAIPAKPYSVIIHMLPAFFNVDYSSLGVGWFQSSNNRFAVISQRGSGFVMESGYSNGPAFSISAAWASAGMGRVWEWVKLSDDGTNRRIYISADGYNWLLFHSVATDTQIVPDRLFFGVNARNASWPIGLTIDSWEEGV